VNKKKSKAMTSLKFRLTNKNSKSEIEANEYGSYDRAIEKLKTKEIFFTKIKRGQGKLFN